MPLAGVGNDKTTLAGDGKRKSCGNVNHDMLAGILERIEPGNRIEAHEWHFGRRLFNFVVDVASNRNLRA